MKVMIVVDPNDDDDDKKAQPGKPNAYWAERRAEEDGSVTEPDNYGGSFRGTRPAPHGGSVTVRDTDVIGSDELCWCGEPAGHDWPGKAAGRKHPKKNVDRSNTMATHARTDRTEAPRIGVRDLRAYHADLQEVILLAVNQYGVKYRLANSQCMLYAPDGVSKPFIVHARNSQREVKSLRIWFAQHVLGVDDQGNPTNPLVKGAEALLRDVVARQDKVDKETRQELADVAVEQLEELARAVNDPAEHPEKKAAKKAASKKAAAQPEKAEGEGSVTEPDGEWVTYVNHKGVENPLFETNGTRYRCRECIGTDHPYDSESRSGIGGHTRMWHRDRENLHGPEARTKAVETSRVNKVTEDVKAAIDLLAGAVGITIADRSAEAELRIEVDNLTEQLLAAEASRDEWKKRAEEVEAKMALAKEFFGS